MYDCSLIIITYKNGDFNHKSCKKIKKSPLHKGRGGILVEMTNLGSSDAEGHTRRQERGDGEELDGIQRRDQHTADKCHSCGQSDSDNTHHRLNGGKWQDFKF